jgi:hypothetical protein
MRKDIVERRVRDPCQARKLSTAGNTSPVHVFGEHVSHQLSFRKMSRIMAMPLSQDTSTDVPPSDQAIVTI